MSAIFGFLGDKAPDAGHADLLRMDQALAGPHDRSAGGACLTGAGMGRRNWRHARVPAGPAVVREGAIAFVLAGRIDNRDTLRAELRSCGCGPVGDSDIELAFAAYRQWGIASFRRIAGIFAFAAWHGDTRRLVLGRSAIDAPPLHYRDDGAHFAFATMPRGLFALPGIARKLDRRMLAMNLIRLSGPDPATLYQGVQRLPTGAVLVKQGEAPALVERWWDGGLDRPLRSGCLAEHAVALRDLLSRVVAEQAGDASPLALMLSGGLDSATIAGIAASDRPDRRLIGLTHVPAHAARLPVPPGWYVDETPFVCDLANKYGALDVRLLPPERDFFLGAHADRVTAAQERHFSNIGNLGWMGTALEQVRAEGGSVVLTGIQGNFTASRSGGMALPVAMAAGRWHDALGALTPRAALSATRMALPDRVNRALTHLRRPGERRPWRLHSPINAAFADAQEIDDCAREWLETYRPMPRFDERPAVVHALRRQDIGLTDHAFASVHGVELRNPLADVRVANFCLAVPNPVFHANGQTRALIRATAEELLPRSVLDNRLRGMQAADVIQRLQSHQHAVFGELESLAQSDLAQEALDLPRLHATAKELQTHRTGGGDASARMLLFGLAMGRFLTWVEREAAS